MDWSAVLHGYAQPLMGFVFFAIGCFPFLVWAGVVTRKGAATGASGYPGHGPTLWFLFLPLVLFVTGLVRGFDTSDPAMPYLEDEWGQVLTLLSVPATGWLLGYVLGALVGRREQVKNDPA